MSHGKFRYCFYIGLLTLVTGLAIAPRSAFANEDGGRKVKTKISPTYPDLARRMNVTGTVKVQVVVAANGTVKSTKVIGGHPLLVESSLDAVKKWKYEPGTEDTTTTVEFVFNGNNN